MSTSLLGNSLGLMAVTTVLAGGLGLPVALAMHLTRPWVRRWLRMATLVALALPAFFVSGMWMELVGFAGAWRIDLGEATARWLPLAMSAWVLALLLWPIMALWLAGVWNRLDLRQLEAEPALRGSVLLREFLWPAVRPALASPMAVTALLVLGNFSVPALFQAHVWPAEVWVEFSTRFDAFAALRSCWPLLLVVGALLAGMRRLRNAWPGGTSTSDNTLLRQRLGTRWQWVVFSSVAIVFALSLGLPFFLTLAESRTWTELFPSLVAAAPAAGRSVVYAGGSATLVVLGGVALSKWRAAMGLAVFLALPGVFIGIGLLGLTGVPGLAWLRSTGWLVLLGFCLRYAFVGWLAANWARDSTDARLLDALRLDGAGTIQEWRHAIGPGSGRILAGAWFVVYLLCLWDVETLLLVVPPGGDSVALMIFNLLHYGHNAQVNALCLLLGALAVLPLAMGWLGRQVARLRPGGRGMSTSLLAALLLLMGCHSGDDGDRSRSLTSAIFERVEVIGARGTGPGYFVKPRSVAVDDADNLYAVDMTGRVQKFASDGRWLHSWQMPETDLGRPKGMEIASGGGIWVVEPHYHRINHFDAEGGLLHQWGVAGTNTGQLWFPRAIALGRNGDCFVAEYGRQERVQRFRNEGGAFLSAFGKEGTGPGELNRAEGLGVDSEGKVYVADSCNHRVQIFSADGRFLRMHGTPGSAKGELRYPYDVRIDREGRQYVCEFGNSRVQVFDAQDQPIEVLGGAGTAPDRMNNPWSLCLDSRGNLFVADALNHRVLKFVRRGASRPPRSPSSLAAAVR